MALFTASKFPLQPYDRPEGVDPLAQPQYLNDAISLQMSDGTVTTVFDTLETGLKALNYLRTHGQYSCLANDDVIVVSINGFRGLIMEQSLINQKLLHSFLTIDMGGAVRWVARTTSLVLDTGDALASVGACVMTPPQSNLQLRNHNITLFDWRYRANPPDSTSGSLLSYSTPLFYDFVSP